MSNAALRTLTLQVDPAANPIAGAVRDERGTNRTFSGWIGLAAALEHAINAVPERATTKSCRTPLKATEIDPRDANAKQPRRRHAERD